MLQLSFENKVAIVTGAGQGIGFEISRQMALLGASVILNDIDPKIGEDATREINNILAQKGKDSGKPSCISFPGDSSDLDFIQRMVDKAVSEFGRLDIVIANSGITLFGNFLNYSPDSFYKVMNVNLGGSFFLAQKAANQMVKQGSGGAILFTSSVTGHQAHKDLAAYSMTKAALEMLAKNLVIELSQYRITVNAIAPGATLTERTLDDPDYENTWSRLTPMGRPASTKDIAHAALFLVSYLANHITGQSLVIDGGWTSVSPPPY